MDPRIEDIIAFWFGDRSPEAAKRWFVKNAAFDGEIRTRFGELQAIAASGTLDGWTATARGALALNILLDQFPRNLFRDDSRSFATDGKALAITQELIASGRIADLAPMEQIFALMPLMHSEDRGVQRESVAQFEKLASELPGDGLLENSADYARKHAEIVERFGRFPHRNKLLGRESTDEEIEFLKQPGSSF